MMNQTNLKKSIFGVLDAVKLAGYSPLTITLFKSTYNRLLRRAADLHVYKFNDVLLESFLNDTAHFKTGAFCRSREALQRSCVKKLREYLEKGYVDWVSCSKRGYETPTSGGFQKLHHEYIEHLRTEQLSANTIDSYRNIARLFLSFLERVGCMEIKMTNAQLIHDFFIDIRNIWDAGSVRTAASGLRAFLEYAEVESKLQKNVPVKLPRKRSIIPILTTEEERSVWNLLKTDVISFRDRSIIMLLLLTGLRAVDIVSLKLSDIDWNNETISITQKKTHAPLILPLVPAIGNALAKYIIQERPKAESPYVFLRSHAPYIPLQGHTSCYAIVKKVFKHAGIRLGTEMKGTRLLRHHVASKMLSNGVAVQTISLALGHVNPNSTDVYLTTDDKVLRECALPLTGITLKVGGLVP